MPPYADFAADHLSVVLPILLSEVPGSGDRRTRSILRVGDSAPRTRGHVRVLEENAPAACGGFVGAAGGIVLGGAEGEGEVEVHEGLLAVALVEVVGVGGFGEDDGEVQNVDSGH